MAVVEWFLMIASGALFGAAATSVLLGLPAWLAYRATGSMTVAAGVVVVLMHLAYFYLG